MSETLFCFDVLQLPTALQNNITKCDHKQLCVKHGKTSHRKLKILKSAFRKEIFSHTRTGKESLLSKMA
jgi:hypothetical protein